jgi:DNA-directed RNA polymerase subunit RPC12/RpoP
MGSSDLITCPRCKSRILQRINRSPLVKTFLGFLPIRSYQCLSCLSTFLSVRKRAKVQ